MAKTKMEWCCYNDGNKIKKKHVNNIEKDEYDSTYKGNLTCIHGCEAKVKFTEKKNKKKFFSTWNKEGNKHNEDCEYYVNYKDEIQRKNLNVIFETIQVTDEQIEASIKRKINDIKKEFKGEIDKKNNQGSKVVINAGESSVNVSSGDTGSENGKVSKRQNITSIEASLINSTYENKYKNVYGIVENVQYSYSESGEIYGYLNLVNEHYKVSVYFPIAYYEGNKFKEDELKKTLNILKEEIENKNKRAIVVCYGMIKLKKNKKNDYNIHIINPKHIIVNEMTMNQILITGELKELDYDLV